jgi:hypothetical protein
MEPYDVEDPTLIIAAGAYVDALYRELASENAAAPVGVANQIVDTIRADPALCRYVLDWAARTRPDEATVRPPERLPRDPVHERLAAAMRTALEAAPEPQSFDPTLAHRPGSTRH